MREVQISTYVKHRAANAINVMLYDYRQGNFSGFDQGETYTHTDADIGEKITLHKIIGGISGMYSGTYGDWQIAQTSGIKVRPANMVAVHYHKTKHTVTI